MNLCVICPQGTTFLSSKEASSELHTDKFIFEYADKYIEELGVHRVIAVIIDNNASK